MWLAGSRVWVRLCKDLTEATQNLQRRRSAEEAAVAKRLAGSGRPRVLGLRVWGLGV